MAAIITSTTRKYKDLDLSFSAHPVTKDVNKHIDDMAVINSLKNLLMTNFYEKPFQPDIGSNIKSLLFENMDHITAISLKKEIETVIQNFENRIRLRYVDVLANFDENAFTVTIEFFLINKTNPITIEFLLERVR